MYPALAFGSLAGYYFWTGLYSNDNERTWKWSDGSPIDYLPWASAYPQLNVSCCGRMSWDGLGQLKDEYCNVTWFIVCKKAALLPSPQPVHSDCPENSAEFQNECYIFQLTATSFPDAELNCLSISGHLVSIHDGFTNAIVTGKNIVLGLTK